MALLQTTSTPTTTTTSKPITTTTTTRKTTTPTATRRTTLSLISNDFTPDIPAALRPNKDVRSWCLNSFILTGVHLVGGLNSGPRQELGKVDTINECMRKCCNMTDCTVAYHDGNSCYALRCLNKNKCKTKIGSTEESVGYVIRNGWSLFKSEQEALQGAMFTNPSSDPENVQTGNPDKNNTLTLENHVGLIDHPSLAQGNNFGYCEKKETLKERRLIEGMKSGVFTNHGDVSDFESCVMYCCHDRSCDLAYMVQSTCYSIKCFSSDSCKTFVVPTFFVNPVIAFVSRTPSNVLKLETSAKENHNKSLSGGVDKNKHLFYADHDITDIPDLSKNRGKEVHKQNGGVSHFNRNKKEKNHHAIPDKKKSVPPESSYLQNLVHQILGEDASGSGDIQSGTGPESGNVPTSGYGSGYRHNHLQHLKPLRLKKHKTHRRHTTKTPHKKHSTRHYHTSPKPTTRTTTRITTTEELKHYFPMDDVDFETIKALSPEKGTKLVLNK